MKPLQVEFSAFGSYPGVVTVDFTRLAPRGLFVVTGDTGTGKTTIFDAMSYALFGEMPSKDGNDIRSHHALDEAPTYARFRFELDGDEYVAERSPEYERPKQRGSGTTKQSATALLQRIAADGTTEPLATRSREMDARVGELIGLSAEQFRRVMLLPQGEVARFLLDDSKDREQLLSALFDGAVYERVTRRLLDEASELAQRVGGVDEELRHLVRTAATAIGHLFDTLGLDEPDALAATDAAGLAEVLEATAGPIAELAEEEATALAVATRDETEHTQAADAARRFDDAAELTTSISAELAAEPVVASAAAAAERSKAARPVTEAAEARRRASDAAGQAKVALDERWARITAAGDGLVLDTGSTTLLLQRIGELRSDLADEQRRHGVHEAAVAAVAAAVGARDQNAASLQAAEEQCVVLSAENDRLGEQIAALAARQVDVSALDAAHESLLGAKRLLAERDRSAARSERCKAASVEADRRFEELLARYVATEAPRLAARLVDGHPCPVCGSADHPAPAVDDGGEAIDTDSVEAARQQRQTAQEEWTSALRDLDDVRVRLGGLADADESVVDADIAENRREHAVARQLADELQELTRRHERLATDLRTANTTRDQLLGVAPVLSTAVAEAEERLAVAAAAVVGVEPASFGPRGTRLDEVARLAAGIDELQRTVIATATQAESAEKALDDALVASGFGTVDEALAVLLDATQELSAIEALRALRSRLETARTKLEVLEQQGVPTERPEVETLRLAASETRQRANALSDRRVRAVDRRDAALEALDRYDRTGSASADLRARAEAARRAADVCHGTVGTKVSLRRWVLGRELERVAVVASEHLRAMTNGRYTIRRVEVGGDKRKAKGLDLEVLDAHTGRPRRPNSLSGGEQFQASLALALGLADVVSHGGTASGRRIEALFIDEGFGSLDPRALDDAIETLHQLHASGRMVGAITHVEAMKERLHPGIVVTRLPDGRGSTLTVNP